MAYDKRSDLSPAGGGGGGGVKAVPQDSIHGVHRQLPNQTSLFCEMDNALT